MFTCNTERFFPDWRATVVVLLGAISMAGAAAHDAIGAATQEPLSASRSIQAALQATPLSQPATRSVLNNLRLWPVPRRLTICFVSGDAGLRKKVVDAIRANWSLADLSEGRLDLDSNTFQSLPDCGPTPSADIRVAFQKGSGHWSYVGAESLNHLPSMNFDGLEGLAAADAGRIVAHEFGHALGLEHEHQSPAAPKDCGWNFPYLRTHYLWQDDAQMHANFDKLQNYLLAPRSAFAYVISMYDKRSVMHYAFEPEAFLQGAKSDCFIAQNYVPSDLDRNAIRVAYAPQLVEDQKVTRGLIPELRAKFTGADYAQVQQLLELRARLLGP